MKARPKSLDRDVARRRWMPFGAARQGTRSLAAWAAAPALGSAEASAERPDAQPQQKDAGRTHEVCTFEVV